MKKLSLDLDALDVRTFATDAADGAEGGTVRGHDDTVETEWCTQEKTCTRIRCQPTDYGLNTCEPYCAEA